MKFLVVITTIILVTQGAPLEDEWEQFKLKYRKTYRNLNDEHERHAVFRKNLLAIQEHNLKFTKGKTSFKLHVSKFADLSPEEFKKTLNMKLSNRNVDKINLAVAVKYSGDIDVDYVKEGRVSPVKNQGNCGSCWAFSTAGTIEGQYSKKYGKCISLSAQDLVDCAATFGCLGGHMSDALEFILRNGISTDDEYPYTSGDGWNGVCKHKATVNITSYHNIPPKDEDALVNSLVKQGPIAVAIDAARLQFYKEGVIDGSSGCSNDPKDLDHGVLLVGAKMKVNDGYYIVKNSWGKDWGMEGMFMMKMNENVCGIANECSYAQM